MPDADDRAVTAMEETAVKFFWGISRYDLHLCCHTCRSSDLR